MTFLMWLGGFIIAFAVGGLTAVFGVGGGFMMTPALMILLGIPGPVAVGTDVAAILINTSYALLKRRNTGTVNLKIAIPIAAGSLAGVWGGVNLLLFLKHMPPLFLNGREIVAAQLILLCCFVALLTSIAAFMLFDYRRNGYEAPLKRVGLFSQLKLPPYGCFNCLEEPNFSIPVLILLGAFVGFTTGLMGVGGGVIYLPALVYLIGLRTAKATGTSLLLVLISSLLAVVLNLTAQNINWPLLTALIAGGMSGVYFGTKIGLSMGGPNLRKYFIYILILAAVLISFEIVRLIVI